MRQDRVRFADGALDDIASLLCAASERASEYLSQAPVLALLSCEKFGSNITFGEIDRFAAAVGPSPRLRAVLSSLGAPQAARKFDLAALRMKDRPAIRELIKLDPSTLSQIIPSVEHQRAWLDGVSQWIALAPTGKRKPKDYHLAWAARHLRDDTSRVETLGALIDYVRRDGGKINPRWTWEGATRAVVEWHARLNDRRAAAALERDTKLAAEFDKVICRAPLPDTALVDGYEFVPLRTRRALRDEGQTMHHCVASYWGAVKKGQSAVVSIRKEGVNLATLEVKKGVAGQLKAHCNGKPSPAIFKAAEHYALRHWGSEQAA